MSGDVEADLLAELCAAMGEETGLRADLALPFAKGVLRYLQREYGGTNLYIPQRKRHVDRGPMAASLISGVPSREVAKQHGITTRQLYRLFPAGLPKPLVEACR